MGDSVHVHRRCDEGLASVVLLLLHQARTAIATKLIVVPGVDAVVNPVIGGPSWRPGPPIAASRRLNTKTRG
jgi:hypothetical protein